MGFGYFSFGLMGGDGYKVWELCDGWHQICQSQMRSDYHVSYSGYSIIKPLVCFFVSFL